MTDRPSQQGRAYDLDRTTAFSDGVFAIAITLLVLSVEIGTDEPNLGDALVDLSPQIFSYALSFAVIGRYWVLHHRLFGDLSYVDGPLTSLNLVYLAFVAFLPFPTEVLGEYGDEPYAVALYAGNTAIVAILGVVMRVYSLNHGLWAGPEEGRKQRREVALAYLTIPAVFLLSIPIAFFVAPSAGQVFWVTLLFVGPGLNHFSSGKSGGSVRHD